MAVYKTRVYGSIVNLGFKVAGVLALFGVIFCIWLARPASGPDPKELRARTARLAVGIHAALVEMKKPPADADAAWPALAELVGCPKCQSEGTIVNKEGAEETCPQCNGVGVSDKQGDALALRRAILDDCKCRTCFGTGLVNRKTCKDCKGSGYDAGAAAGLLRALAAGTLKDGWGRRFRLDIQPAGRDKILVEVRSAGPDGVFGNRDDVVVPQPAQ